MRIRSGEVDSRRIVVIDDVVDASLIHSFYDGLTTGPFKRTEVASRETAAHRHWVWEMGLDQLKHSDLWTATRHVIAQVWDGESYEPFRAYTNYAAFGDMLFTHLDCGPDAREVTALWYICPEWEIEWGGETLFYDDSGVARFVVSMRPGRLVLFDGAIRHVGRPPNRIFFGPRYTFAIKI